MDASARSEIMRGGPKQSLRQKMPKEENIAWQHNTGGNKKGNLLDKREEALQRPELERFSKRQCGSYIVGYNEEDYTIFGKC